MTVSLRLRRLPTGGRIDRAAPLGFTFDGQRYTGYRGDTLASALLANGVDVVARSIYRGRPRGIMAAGSEEPNALVQLESGSASEPMLRATQVELYDGLRASSLAGRGRLVAASDQGRFDKMYIHCDVLVVGAGPAGLAAALAAGRAGARVVLVDEQPEVGGSLLSGNDRIDGISVMEWAARTRAELAGLPDVRLMERSTAVGYYDHNYLLVAERRTVHLPLEARGTGSDERLWHIRAKQVVLATGAHERPIVFADNDRPGIMLAGGVRAYLHRYAVLPGERAVVFTTNDSAYATAFDLASADASCRVEAIVDVRQEVAGHLVEHAADMGIPVFAGHVVAGTTGDDRLTSVSLGRVAGGADPGEDLPATLKPIECDLLAVSGGWNPVVHLFSQSRGRLHFDDSIAAFVPGESVQPEQSVGACRGSFRLADCLADGFAAGVRAAERTGFADASGVAPVAGDEAPLGSFAPVWLVPPVLTTSWEAHFVDLQRDAHVGDLQRAVGAGLRSVEHVKRYTTVGTASDQGKTSGVLASAIAGALMGQPAGEAGVTTFRPPYTPVSFALLAGRDRGELHDPIRTTSIHSWHVAQGAIFEDVGQWKRPRYFPLYGEDMDRAVLRECAAARTGVAMMDATTLGKIDIQGADAGEFLNRVYANAFAKLPVGSCRYGVMCRADGMVFDDGVTSRLADDRFTMTTTTGNAAPVLDWLEEWLQTEWPELRVHCTSVTEQWATIAVVGPRSRDVLRALAPEIDFDAAAFPFMTWREGVVAGTRARIFRISFSGELAYEINVPTWHGLAMWAAVYAAGQAHGITPYGTETMHVLRAEKGYPIIGQETDGTVTPQDLGMDWIVSKTKPFIGQRSHRRPDTAREDRKHLVGLLPVDPDALLPEGAQLVLDPDQPIPLAMVGHVTSSYRSAALGRTFALALIKSGRNRIGETVYAPLPGETIAATITESVLYDKEGERRDG